MMLNRPNGATKKRIFWRWPTFPPGCPGSIIGAGGLNDRVRDGTGCGSAALITRKTFFWQLCSGFATAFSVAWEFLLRRNIHFHKGWFLSSTPPPDLALLGLSSPFAKGEVGDKERRLADG
jgi:hypothetical protein